MNEDQTLIKRAKLAITAINMASDLFQTSEYLTDVEKKAYKRAFKLSAEHVRISFREWLPVAKIQNEQLDEVNGAAV